MIAAHVIYGQGGRLTSLGMDKLADRIRMLRAPVLMWGWREYDKIIRVVAEQVKRGRVPVIAGYSLGANSASWIAHELPQVTFALLALIDPSNGLPWLGLPARVYPIGLNVKRTIHFKNVGPSILGHSAIVGNNVEVRKVVGWHPLLDFDESIQKAIVDAVQQVVAPKP